MVTIDKIAVMEGHKGAVYTLVADAARLGYFYSAGGDGMVVEWNEDDFDNGKLAAKVGSKIFSMLPLHEQGLFLLGQMEGGIHVLDLEKNKEIKHLALHSNGVFDLQLSADKTCFYSTGGDGTIGYWTVNGQQLIKQVSISEESARCVALHPTLPLIAVGCSDNCTYILDTGSFNIWHKLEGHTNSVFCVCFSPDGQWLLTGSRDAQLMVWNVKENFQIYRQIAAHLSTINNIVYSPDANLFATASRDKSIRIWDANSFGPLKTIDQLKSGGHKNSVNKLIWPGNLFSCSDDRMVMAWQITK